MNKKRLSTIVIAGLALVLFYLFPEQRVIVLTVLGAIIGMFGGVGAAILGGLIFLVLSANNYIIPIVLAVIIGYNILLLAQKTNTSSDSQITDPDSLSNNQVSSQNPPQIDTVETKDVCHPVAVEPKIQPSTSPAAKIHRLRRRFMILLCWISKRLLLTKQTTKSFKLPLLNTKTIKKQIR